MATIEKEVKTPKVEKASLNVLKRDFKFYPREQVDYSTIERFKNAMEAGAIFPPIRICAKTLRIIDGFHRFVAYQERHVDVVNVIAEEDIKDDADFFTRAVEANKTHGLGYNAADHRKIVKVAKLLNLHREKISLAMAIPVQRFEELKKAAPLPSGRPFKIGEHRDRSIADKNRKERTSVPTGYYFFFNQVISFLKSDGCDLTNQDILYKLRELDEALSKKLNPEGKALTPLVLPAPVKEYYIEWAKREKLPLINHVVETLILAAEIDLDGEELTDEQREKWLKKFRPHTVMYRKDKGETP